MPGIGPNGFKVMGPKAADLVIEAAGSSEAIKLAFEVVRRHGKISALGISGKETTDVPWDKAIFKAPQLTFCFSSSWQSWETVLRLMEKGTLKPEEIIITCLMPFLPASVIIFGTMRAGTTIMPRSIDSLISRKFE